MDLSKLTFRRVNPPQPTQRYVEHVIPLLTDQWMRPGEILTVELGERAWEVLGEESNKVSAVRVTGIRIDMVEVEA